MKVQVISYTMNPELVVATAAKLCYSNSSISDLMACQTDNEIERFINVLLSSGHESPFEHVSFTFAIEDVSRSLLAQITRHRIASFSVQSQRYVDMSNPEFIIPPAVKDAGLEDAYINFCNLFALAYKNVLANLVDKYTKEGKPVKEATKVAQEDARFVLPESTCTKIITTMNARQLRHFFNVRCCNRAQWEIRNLADMMLALVKQIAPMLFAGCGPNCVWDKCSEGKMTCGKPRTEEELFCAKAN